MFLCLEMMKMSRETSSALLAPNKAERQKLAFSQLQMGIGMPTHNNSIFISLQGFLGPAQLLPVWSTQTTNIARAKHMRFSQNEGCQLHKARLVYK
jgi:hypothetical protein